MKKLQFKKCLPCEGKVKAFNRQDAQKLLLQVSDWNLTTDGRGIFREYLMKDFRSAIELIKRIAAIAEKENHHPDVHLVNYRRLRIDLSTHAIAGLSENDFIIAAKINHLPAKLHN